MDIRRPISLALMCALSFNHALLYAQEPVQIEIEIDSAPVDVQLPSSPKPATPEPAVVKEPPAPPTPTKDESPAVAETPEPQKAPPAAEPKEEKAAGKVPGLAIGALVAGLLAAMGGGGGGGGGSTTSH